MFKRSHHQKIASVLEQLDSHLLQETGTCFGGGTLITLLHGEYRLSNDIDFICPVGDGYRQLRTLVADAAFQPSFLFRSTKNLSFPRPLRADQYGLRFLVMMDDAPIKFEIIAEGRIALEKADFPLPVQLPCLSRTDRYAEKLLANADRWADTSIRSRDLIDLAMLRREEGANPSAVAKAENAYPVVMPLRKAVAHFQQNADYQSQCLAVLEIADVERALEGVNLLAKDVCP